MYPARETPETPAIQQTIDNASDIDLMSHKSGLISIKVLKRIHLFIISIGVLLSLGFFPSGSLARSPVTAIPARLQQIQTRIDEGDLSRAEREIGELESASLSGSDRASLLAISGNLAFRSGDYTTAIDRYRSAAPSLAGIDRDSLSLNLARAHLYRSRLPSGEEGDRSAAIGLFHSGQNSARPAIAIRSRLELLD